MVRDAVSAVSTERACAALPAVLPLGATSGYACGYPGYRADIDGLRAIAIVAVIGFHAFPDTLRGGFVGVDVFFVIPGYLITSILLRSLAEGTFSITGFYARRVRRIFPALLGVLLASYVAGWFVLLADEYRQLGKHIAAGAAFVANIALLMERLFRYRG